MDEGSEKFFNHLVSKDMIESILKSWAWVLATAAIFRICLESLKMHQWFFGLITFCAFIALSGLVTIYVALYVAIPLKVHIENPNALKEKTWSDYFRHPFRSLFSIPLVFYLTATIGFFLFSSQLVKYIAGVALPHG